MDYSVDADMSPPLIECLGGVETVGDALSLIAACGEHDTDRVLLQASALPPSFFELSTGFAGEFIQKLVNYRLRVAGVFPPDRAYPERFREYLLEARRGPQFRAFVQRPDALVWLGSV
ncbi:DUF4180 domain-containing protein [Caldimonas brevitalea]|uniref:Transcriptional regulator, PadR family n=1 Tax=Caldimonas brevitalea TaxID=413882 RepID=A0A0G3BX19_9BURK|nr:DUF4180 domain-containing protein [Caldimonas brevitalea]AKJ31911.1 transcriptional regulator, PadR family [Caldimonas brevitalea]